MKTWLITQSRHCFLDQTLFAQVFLIRHPPSDGFTHYLSRLSSFEMSINWFFSRFSILSLSLFFLIMKSGILSFQRVQQVAWTHRASKSIIQVCGGGEMDANLPYSLQNLTFSRFFSVVRKKLSIYPLPRRGQQGAPLTDHSGNQLCPNWAVPQGEKEAVAAADSDLRHKTTGCQADIPLSPALVMFPPVFRCINVPLKSTKQNSCLRLLGVNAANGVGKNKIKWAFKSFCRWTFYGEKKELKVSVGWQEKKQNTVDIWDLDKGLWCRSWCNRRQFSRLENVSEKQQGDWPFKRLPRFKWIWRSRWFAVDCSERLTYWVWTPAAAQPAKVQKKLPRQKNKTSF